MHITTEFNYDRVSMPEQLAYDAGFDAGLKEAKDEFRDIAPGRVLDLLQDLSNWL